MDEKEYLKKEIRKHKRITYPLGMALGIIVIIFGFIGLGGALAAAESAGVIAVSSFIIGLGAVALICGLRGKRKARYLEIVLEAYDKKRERIKAQLKKAQQPKQPIYPCPSCGKTLPPDWVVCVYCGKRLKKSDERRMKVVSVDVREPQPVISILRKELEGNDFTVKVRQNPVSDIYLGNLVGIERKTGDDFIRSVYDGRLLEQVKNLNKNFQYTYIIVEGNINNMLSEELRGKEWRSEEWRDARMSSILEAICSCMARYSIPVIFAGNYLPKIVNYLFKKHTDEKKVELEHFVPTRIETNFPLSIILSFPGVGFATAKRLLKKFGSVKGVVNASVDDMAEVEGIGIKKAKKIKKSLSG